MVHNQGSNNTAALKGMSPSRSSRTDSPNSCKRVCQQDHVEELKPQALPRWKGGLTRGSSLSVNTNTRIPRYPAVKGKENIRGRGSARAGFGRAKIVKPIITASKTKFTKKDMDDAQNVLIEISRDSSMNAQSPRPKPTAKSPIMLQSKLVPDLHQKILEKIRHNKRRSRSFQLTRSPCKAPAVPVLSSGLEDVEDVEDPDDSEKRDSPVSCQDLEAYLASVFNMCDKYRSGTVQARSLFEFISNLVDLPRLDLRKFEELERLLDPNNDNRYIDMDTWSSVGRTWVDMIMNPDFHSLSMSSSDKSSEACEDHDDNCHFIPEKDEEELLTNISFGSIEGYGVAGDLVASAREIELEGKVNELNFQLKKVRDEKRNLEKNLIASEEFGLSLTTELEDSNRRLSLSSSILSKGDKCQDGGKYSVAKEWEQECHNLQRKVTFLEDEVTTKDEKLNDLEVLIVSLKSEIGDTKDKEESAFALIEKYKEKIANMERTISIKNEEINREIVARELIEEKFEETRSRIDKLEQDLSMKDEELRNLTETTGSRLGSVGSSAGNNSFSTVHDVSVDEQGLEENLRVNNCLNFQTPGKLGFPNQMVRIKGPSASSTPNKGSLGSIAEELMSHSNNECFPSPFCEKKNKTKIGILLNNLIESFKKAIGSQFGDSNKKKIMLSIMKEVQNVKNSIETILDELPSKEELHSLKETNKDLEERLLVANTAVENLKSQSVNNNYIEDDDEEVAEEEVANVSVKLEAVSKLLEQANSALLSHTDVGIGELGTDMSLEPESDVSGWQLDLEGIQLGGWQQRLANYSKKRLSGQGHRSAFPTELSRSPVPGTQMWQSLYRKLEDLDKASEVTFDLVQIAVESLREHSQLQISTNIAALSKSRNITEVCNVACQTMVKPDLSISTPTQTEYLPEVIEEECHRENCFCPKSQARAVETKKMSRLRSLFKGVFFMVLLLIAFTFLGGLEIDGDLYYPVTWYSLRAGLGDVIPEPVIGLSYQTGCQRP